MQRLTNAPLMRTPKFPCHTTRFYRDSFAGQTRTVQRGGVTTTIGHGALDMVTQPIPAVVVSAGWGRVTRVGWSGYGGWTAYVDSTGSSGTKYRLYYAHMAFPAVVKRGQYVVPGDPIGVVGNTGGAKGHGAPSKEGERFAGPKHLHFAMYANGVAYDPWPEMVRLLGPAVNKGGFVFNLPMLPSARRADALLIPLYDTVVAADKAHSLSHDAHKCKGCAYATERKAFT